MVELQSDILLVIFTVVLVIGSLYVNFQHKKKFRIEVESLKKIQNEIEEQKKEKKIIIEEEEKKASERLSAAKKVSKKEITIFRSTQIAGIFAILLIIITLLQLTNFSIEAVNSSVLSVIIVSIISVIAWLFSKRRTRGF